MSTSTPSPRRYHLYRFRETDPAPFGVEGETFPTWWSRHIEPEEGEVWVPIEDERWAARVRPGDVVWFAREDSVFGVAVVTRVQADPVHRRHEVWWAKPASRFGFDGPFLSGVWSTRRVTHAQARRWFMTTQISEDEIFEAARAFFAPARPEPVSPVDAAIASMFNLDGGPPSPVRSWQPHPGEVSASALLTRAAAEGALALMPVRVSDGTSRTLLAVRVPSQAGEVTFCPLALFCRAGDSITLSNGTTLILPGPTPPPHVPTPHDN